jgi:hypothetical protein
LFQNSFFKARAAVRDCERQSVKMKAVSIKIENTSKPLPRSSFAQTVSALKEKLGENWLPRLYFEKVRSLRTRSHKLEVDEKENRTEIQHTLLGVELKIGNLRISCPDLATARFLQVFARIGCSEVAIPYDITKISVLADELESSWQRFLLLLEQETVEKTSQSRSRLRSGLVKELRLEIAEIGAGEAIPQFRQSTKQRRT